jgi:hypothetical protein
MKSGFDHKGHKGREGEQKTDLPFGRRRRKPSQRYKLYTLFIWKAFLRDEMDASPSNGVVMRQTGTPVKGQPVDR